MKLHTIKPAELSSHRITKDQVATFLRDHLDEYGDDITDIQKCLKYVEDRGGLVIVAEEDEQILGVTVLNETGMSGYIPDNILVYIAVDRAARGRGLGRALLNKAFEETTGSIALHVEPENPAKFLYEKMGFTNKYLEMRWKRPAE